MLGNHKHAAVDRSVYLTTHLTHATMTKITAMQGLSWLDLEFIKLKVIKTEIRIWLEFFFLHVSDSNIEKIYTLN